MPGLDLFGTIPKTGNRGSIVMDGVPYFVNDDSLYSVDSAGTATLVGGVSGSGMVSLAHNGTYLVIVVPGGNAYTYNKDTAVYGLITDTDFITSDIVVYKDGYFVFTATAGQRVFLTLL